jgi:hypothetical protein
VPIYVVEIDGKQYDIEGDRPPTEAEARGAIGGTGAAPTQAPTPAPQAEPAKGAVRRFLEPIGDAAKGLASLPGALISMMPGDTDINPFGRAADALGAVGGALVKPSVDQAKGAVAAAGRGDIGEAALRALAVADVGGVGADIGESAAEGNIAGALGQTAVAAAPLVSKLPIKPTAIAGLLRKRAAARILDVMRPAKGGVAAAENVADDLVMGLAERQTAGGIGTGNLETLAKRARVRADAAGKEIEALQHLDTPIEVRPAADALRREASSLETTPPPQKVLEEVESSILDDAGEPIVGIAEKEIASKPITGHPALVSALRAEAKMIDDLATQYPDSQVPAGELFKQRAAIGRRVAKAYQQAPGAEAAAGMEAGKSSRQQITRILHEGVPASKIPDREYRVFRTAWTQIESHRRGSLTNRGLKGLKDLLAGRAAGAALGAGVGSLGMGPLGGVAGALGGVVLGESAYWGSLRASTYAALSKALNSGQLDEAANILQRSTLAYSAEKGIKERERNHEAQAALRSQAEGVITP